MKAIWNGQVIAESDDTVKIEGNHYFPSDAIVKAFIKPSDTNTTCYWKGVASYFTLLVEGKENKDAAWYYPTTRDQAKNIEGRVAFWKGVQVTQ